MMQISIYNTHILNYLLVYGTVELRMRRAEAVGRKTISEDSVTLWVNARRKGESYRNIGRRFGVDPRTVKLWVQRTAEESEKEHWEAVSRQVDAKYLDEHYRMLLQIAAALLDAVHTDPVSAHHKLDARLPLDNSVQSAVQRSAGLLASRGLDMSSTLSQSPSSTGIKDNKSERMGRRLFDALMEHEPELERFIQAWQTQWANFQQERLKLIDVAGNLFGQREISTEMAKTLKIPVVREALMIKLLDQEPRPSRVDEISEKKARLIGRMGLNETVVHAGPKQEVEAAQKAYDWVLSQISHKERIDPVIRSYHSLMDQVREAEDCIDHLILMGKPWGKCTLCLNRPIHSL
jgi:hypothetical protein